MAARAWGGAVRALLPPPHMVRLLHDHTLPISPSPAACACVQALERVFRICDRDVDGVLSADEYGHLLRKGDPIHLPEHHIERLFQVRAGARLCAGSSTGVCA